MSNQAGKGDKRRPQSVSLDQMDLKWEKAFSKKTWREWSEVQGDWIKSPDAPGWRENPNEKMSLREYRKGLPYCTLYDVSLIWQKFGEIKPVSE